MPRFKPGDIVQIDGIDGELEVMRSHVKTITATTKHGETIRAPEHRVTRARRVREPYKRKERPCDLTAVARRFNVQKRTILEWARQKFLPPPDQFKGEPVWWPGALDAFEMIVWSHQGQPDLDKLLTLSRLLITNRKDAYQWKKRR